MKVTTFLQTAYLIAQESKCVSWSVGALIEKNGRIISTGYNGSPAGGLNCCDHAREQGWMNHHYHKSKKYLVKNSERINQYYESDEIPEQGLYTEIPENASLAKLVKADDPLGSHIVFYKNEKGITYIWSNEYRFTKQLSSDNPSYGWYSTGEWFSNINNSDRSKGLIVWSSKNLDTQYRPIIVLDPVHRADHSKWSAVNEIHAELNAILYAARNGLSIDGATMYVTLSPCADCCKAIAQSGIKKLVYCETYDKAPANWSDILRNAGIEVYNVDKSRLTNLNWENIKTFGGPDA